MRNSTKVDKFWMLAEYIQKNNIPFDVVKDVSDSLQDGMLFQMITHVQEIIEHAKDILGKK